MSEAMGDALYIKPIEKDEDQWTGRVVSRGIKVIKNTTYYECDLVVYKDVDIISKPKYNGVRVHKVWFQNITKIEGVY